MIELWRSPEDNGWIPKWNVVKTIKYHFQRLWRILYVENAHGNIKTWHVRRSLLKKKEKMLQPALSDLWLLHWVTSQEEGRLSSHSTVFWLSSLWQEGGHLPTDKWLTLQNHPWNHWFSLLGFIVQHMASNSPYKRRPYLESHKPPLLGNYLHAHVSGVVHKALI